jgi:hypothetical protein
LPEYEMRELFARMLVKVVDEARVTIMVVYRD